jgi:hypothetical protein
VDEELDADLDERVLELCRLVRGIDVDENRTHTRRRELRHDPLVSVRRPDADAVALLDAAGKEAPGCEVDLLTQLGVRRSVALVADDERLPGGMELDGSPERLADRRIEQGDDRRAGGVRVCAPISGGGASPERAGCHLVLLVAFCQTTVGRFEQGRNGPRGASGTRKRPEGRLRKIAS